MRNLVRDGSIRMALAADAGFGIIGHIKQSTGTRRLTINVDEAPDALKSPSDLKEQR
jgi:hypothetical protein